MMATYIYIAVCTWLLVWTTRTWLALRQNITKAKATGIPYRVSLISGAPGYIWRALHEIFLHPLRNYLPKSHNWLWPKLLHPHRSWNYTHELREELGEVYLIVTPQPRLFLSSSNVEATLQMCTRRFDFVKPVENYSILDIFGPSILTTEGLDWRRHQKIVGAAFSEKSNSLVWRESLRQSTGMLELWARATGNDHNVMKIENISRYTALLALHIICAAGFGIRQLWDGEDEEQLGTSIVPGFNTTRLTGTHKLTFRDSLDILLHHIIWLAIFPISLLRKSPFQMHKKLVQAYSEVGSYFTELSAWKLQQLDSGAATEKDTMDIMGPLVNASQVPPSDTKGNHLAPQEVVSNSWILLLAGHESSANVAHLGLVFLAIDLPKQFALQADIDSVVGARPPAEWTYENDLGKLWNSLAGATIQETLRLMPPAIDIPKIVRSKPQTLAYDGKTVTVPANTMIQFSVVGVHRNPRYWPAKRSLLSSKSHDLDDFVPERWLPAYADTREADQGIGTPSSELDNTNEITTSFGTPSKVNDTNENTTSFSPSSTLFLPQKGAFMPFSEGARSCPGKRFAQIEICAILSTIFKDHTVELDVSEWASDKDLEQMGKEERKVIYGCAMRSARRKVANSKTEIVLQMKEKVPVRVVKRGGERFAGCF